MSLYWLVRPDEGARTRLTIKMWEKVCVEETGFDITAWAWALGVGGWDGGGVGGGLLVPISALMDAERHFVGTSCHRHLAKDRRTIQ